MTEANKYYVKTETGGNWFRKDQLEAEMADDAKGFLVVLDKDIPEEAALATAKAILLLKNVVSVEAVVADRVEDQLIESRTKHHIRKKILDILQ